jgi:hypothetical protein
VLAIRIHFALVSDTNINFGALRPVYDDKCENLVYVYDENLNTFGLNCGNRKLDIENALKLITYLRMVVYVDGQFIRNLLTAENATIGPVIYNSLPDLPKLAIPSRSIRSRFTPRKKPRVDEEKTVFF